MVDLIKTVNTVVGEEYGRAAAKFGPTNNSDHESFGILLEEYEEARYEDVAFSKAADNFWNLIKENADDSEKMDELNSMFHSAIYAACEWIQVAAMAYKAQKTIEERNQQ